MYAPIFKDGADEYIFIQVLGQSIQGQAQLVLHVQSGEYRVRKISKHMNTLTNIQTSTDKHELDMTARLTTAHRHPLR